MNLVKLKGTDAQIKKAEKRRVAFIGKWTDRLEKFKNLENATDKQKKNIKDAIEYLSQIKDAVYWNKIPTGSVDYPRPEAAEMDMRLYNFMIQTQLDWLEVRGIRPNFLDIASKS